MDGKKLLRQEMLQKRNEQSAAQRERASREIADKLYALPFWQQAHTIGITLSMAGEVDTYPIIKRAWAEGKRVAVPKCNRTTRELVFRELTDFTELEVVYMQLREPIPAITEEVASGEIDLLLVPGVAFTREGDRLGYGGGYYDRFLASYKGHTLSLVYAWQLVPQLPMDAHDQRVQVVVTE